MKPLASDSTMLMLMTHRRQCGSYVAMSGGVDNESDSWTMLRMMMS